MSQQAKPKRPKTLRELKKIWYKKLEKSGFNDIESSEYDLKSPSRPFRNIPSRNGVTLEDAHITWGARQEYYYLAEHFLNEYIFETQRDRNIWAYHTAGISIRDITKILNKLPGKKTNRDAIWTVVKRLSTIMKEKNLKK